MTKKNQPKTKEKRPRGRPKKYSNISLPARPNRKIVLNEALEMRLKGLTYKQIGEYFNCTHSAVVQMLKPYVQNDKIDLSQYEKQRHRLIKLKEAELLTSLTDDEIKNMQPAQKVMAFGILFDKTHILEAGHSPGAQPAITITIAGVSQVIQVNQSVSALPDPQVDVTQDVNIIDDGDDSGAS